jgi:hypothetical protein
MRGVEPMEELMSLLRPEALLAKVITGGGQWSIRKPRYGDPAFCLMLEGSCVLDADGLDSIELRHGDFLLRVGADQHAHARRILPVRPS